VHLSYDAPFNFTGTIGKVVLELASGKLSAVGEKKLQDGEAQIKTDGDSHPSF